MAFIDSIRRRFGRGEKSLTLKDPQLAFITDALLGVTSDSIKGREYTASPWVYKAANIWASASGCPLVAHKVSRDGKEEPTDLPFIFRSPNPDDCMSDICEQSLRHLALCGRAMWLLDEGEYRPGREPMNIRVVQPERMSVDRNDIDYLGRIRQWTLTVDSRPRKIDPQSVVYIRLPSPYKPGLWQSPIDALIETVDADFQARRHNKFLMKQHGRIPGVISYDDDLDSDELKRRSRLFHELYGNSEAAGKWLHVVKTKVTQMSMTSKDMDWEAALKIFREEVAAVFDIPPPNAGILDKATYSNFEQADKTLVEGCFIPKLHRLASAMNKQVLDRAGINDVRVSFDAENHYAALQESEVQRIEKYEKLVKSGVSPAVAADIAGLDIGEHSPAHNTIWMPSSMIAVGGDLALVADDKEPAVAGMPTEKVQDQALNGAQISSLLEVIAKISEGTLTPEGAIGVLVVAFPTIDEAEARRIVAGAIKVEMPVEAEKMLQKAARIDGKGDDGDKRTEALRSAVWRAQMQRRLPHEKKAQKAIKKFLFDQRAAALKSVDEVVAGTGTKEFKTRALTAEEIADLLLDAGWDEELVKRMTPLMLAAGTAAARRILEDMGKPSDLFSEAAIRNLIEQQAELLPRVNESTRTALNESAQTLIDSVASGESIDTAANRLREDVRKVFGGSEARATLIARTEIGRAMEGARFEQLKGAGIATKVWISSRDSEVRDLHRSIDGEEVPVDRPFSNGLMYPLDPAGSAAQTVNCRCTCEAGQID